MAVESKVDEILVGLRNEETNIRGQLSARIIHQVDVTLTFCRGAPFSALSSLIGRHQHVPPLPPTRTGSYEHLIVEVPTCA